MNGESIEDRRKHRNGEANRIVWWLLATITGIAVSGAWFWVSGITLRVTNVEAGQILSIERIARLEEGLKGLSKDIAKIDGKLETTNDKLDRLLRRGS